MNTEKTKRLETDTQNESTASVSDFTLSKWFDFHLFFVHREKKKAESQWGSEGSRGTLNWLTSTASLVFAVQSLSLTHTQTAGRESTCDIQRRCIPNIRKLKKTVTPTSEMVAGAVKNCR